ncbi:hypothetical protein M0802_010856 [Mischocyttarus mexicanus]|nr:hypothetical protein M0802_010856 [Mischocyttarus mexicanus]
MADGEDAEQETRRALDVVQSMIDISADRLEGLRTQCSTSAELTQQEIRTLEGKLIKLYSKQLVTKAKLSVESLPAEMRQYPSLQQWLRVVGLTQESIQLEFVNADSKMVCSKANSLEALKEKSEHELGTMLGENNVRHKEELRRLCRALHNLRRYMDALLRGDVENSDMNLYWDSWDRHHLRSGASPRLIRSRITRCSVPSEDSIPYHNNNNNLTSDMLAQASSITSLSSTSPPSTPLLQRQGHTIKFPTTPPPYKKHQIGLQNTISQPEVFPLTKSKSHESQLANRLENGDTASSCASDHHVSSVGRRNRLLTETGSCSSNADIMTECFLPNSNSPIKSPPYSSADSDDNSFKGTVITSLQVPKSPRTPTVTRGMGHIIAHRFTKTFKMMTTCDYCDKQMFIGTGLKCKECKYKCHRDCESKVPPSCGLPQELFDEFKRSVQGDGMVNVSPILNKPSITSPNHHSSNLLASLNRRDRKRSHPHSSMNIPFPGADSSSNTSSCNSSTPSSPALLPANTSQTSQASMKQQFHFPDVVLNDKGVTLETHRLESTAVSSDSERTVSVSGSGSVSTDSERTPVRVDSQDSQVSDGEPGDSRWPRQNSVRKLFMKGNGLSISPGWLCYLAPEIVRRLKPQQTRDQEELPFTDASDVYAFGTVWYELLCGEWPFKGQPPEAIIWQVGKGMKQPLANLQASRDVKDILMFCWSYHPENRPDFAKLLTTLEKLPRKRLERSPSHPTHLSRSAESVF